MPHFIYCGEYYFDPELLLETMMIRKLKEYGIESSILTYLSAYRKNLITQEKFKLAYEGKMKHARDWKDY